MARLLIDSCVLIDYLRRRRTAIDYVESLEHRPLVSVVTVAELYAGTRNPGELVRVERLIGGLVPLAASLEIATIGGHFLSRYRPSHGLAIADAMIAATAQLHDARLVTRNIRHFPMLDDVLVPYQG